MGTAGRNKTGGGGGKVRKMGGRRGAEGNNGEVHER
jgi:hypothetical protein